MIDVKGKCSCLADFFLLQEKEGDYCRFNQGEQDCRNCLPRSGFVQQFNPPDFFPPLRSGKKQVISSVIRLRDPDIPYLVHRSKT